MQFGTLDDNLGTTPSSLEYFYNKPRDVPGPGFLTGHYMRNPGSDWRRRALEQKMRVDATGGIPGPELEINLKQKRDRERQEFRDDYLTKTGPKMMQGYVQILAKLGMKAVERDLKRRQEALRQVLTADELRWQSLEEEMAAQQATDRLAEAKRFTEKVRAEQEAKRLQLVAEKREQHDREKSDVLRSLQATKNVYNCKETNLCQMRDKRDRLEADREITRLYSELGKKTCKSQLMRDEMDARKRLARNVQQMDALRAQISYQQNQNQTHRNKEISLEAQRIRLLQEEECKQKEEEKYQKLKEQEKIRTSFEDQIALRRRRIMEDTDMVAAEDEKRNMANREYLLKENEGVEQNKKSAKVEMKMFLNHMAAIKEEQAQQEKLTEDMIEKSRSELEKRMDQRRYEERAARKQLVAKTLEERAQQIKEKEETRKWEEELRKEEWEEAERLRHCQKALRADYEQRMLQEKKKYAADLKNQLRFQCVLKEREEEEKENFRRRCQEEDKKYLERVEELMNKPEKTAVHPNRLKIAGRAK